MSGRERNTGNAGNAGDSSVGNHPEGVDIGSIPSTGDIIFSQQRRRLQLGVHVNIQNYDDAMEFESEEGKTSIKHIHKEICLLLELILCAFLFSFIILVSSSTFHPVYAIFLFFIHDLKVILYALYRNLKYLYIYIYIHIYIYIFIYIYIYRKPRLADSQEASLNNQDIAEFSILLIYKVYIYIYI